MINFDTTPSHAFVTKRFRFYAFLSFFTLFYAFLSVFVAQPSFSVENTVDKAAEERKKKAEIRRITKKLNKVDSQIEKADQELLRVSRQMNSIASEIKDLNDQENQIRQNIQAQVNAKAETAKTALRIERMPLDSLIFLDTVRDAYQREGIIKKGRESLFLEMKSLRQEVAELENVLQKRAEKLLKMQEASNRQLSVKERLSKSYKKQLKLLKINDFTKSEMLDRAHEMKQKATLAEMLRLQKILDETLMPKARNSAEKAVIQGVLLEDFNEKNELGVRSHGIKVFLTPASDVFALKDGRVIFSDSFGVYEHVVILEHADGANSLYSGLNGSHVAVGDFVHVGKSIGQMANSEKPELYIEVRKNDKPVNPRKWL